MRSEVGKRGKAMHLAFVLLDLSMQDSEEELSI